MSENDNRIDIFWKEIPNLSTFGNGMVNACTRVDVRKVNDFPNTIVKSK